MTPHPNCRWTNIHAAFARYECQTYCYCNNTVPKADHELWAIAINKLNEWTALRKGITDGTITTYDFVKIAQDGVSTVMASVDAPASDGSTSSNCREEACAMPWDTNVLGALPGLPPPPFSDLIKNQVLDESVDSNEISALTSGPTNPSPSSKPSTCAKENTPCSKTSDCGPGDGCSCRSWASSFDRTFFSQFLAVLAVGLMDSSPTLPRDLGVPTIDDGPCACNCTYVSKGCCEASSDGIVH